MKCSAALTFPSVISLLKGSSCLFLCFGISPSARWELILDGAAFMEELVNVTVSTSVVVVLCDLLFWRYDEIFEVVGVA